LRHGSKTTLDDDDRWDSVETILPSNDGSVITLGAKRKYRNADFMTDSFLLTPRYPTNNSTTTRLQKRKPSSTSPSMSSESYSDSESESVFYDKEGAHIKEQVNTIK
jgi:hypothetical protein